MQTVTLASPLFLSLSLFVVFSNSVERIKLDYSSVALFRPRRVRMLNNSAIRVLLIENVRV